MSRLSPLHSFHRARLNGFASFFSILSAAGAVFGAKLSITTLCLLQQHVRRTDTLFLLSYLDASKSCIAQVRLISVS